jgi:1-aminocyclopropane-1-carboxylate deaminase/D-cysteine desulfhydrase-like pyridoxal-dependent ACC family enzyme
LDADFGGSKIRSLNVQIPRAIEEKATILLMAARCGSNSIAAASLLAPKYGLRVAAFLKPQPNSTIASFNLRLINSTGTIIYPVPHGTLLHNNSLTIKNGLKNLKQNNHRPYLIGFGGGDDDSAFAQIKGIEELSRQINAGLCDNVDRIYVAGATFSVAAGLAAGISIFNLDAQLVIIGLAHEHPPAEEFFNKAEAAARRYIKQYNVPKKKRHKDYKP